MITTQFLNVNNMKYLSFILIIIFAYFVSGSLANIGEVRVVLPKKAIAKKTKTIKKIVKIYYGLEAKIANTFPECPEVAIAVSKAESGLNPSAISPTDDWGLMQINRPSHISKFTKSMLDIDENLRVARIIYLAEGWTKWSAFTNGSYLKYL
jgi:soluble lytic murein transglycosylase-like protein